MIGFTFRPNMVFEWNGVSYRIVKLEKNDDVLLESLIGTGLSIEKKDNLLKEYLAGNISVKKINNPLRDKFDPPLFTRPLDELSEKLRAEVNRRCHYLEKIFTKTHPVFTDDYLTPIIQEVALEMNDKKPPSYRTVGRWYKLYQKNQDNRALIPRTDLRGSKLLKQHDRILQLLSEALEEEFNKTPQAATPNIHDKLTQKIENENKARLGVEKLIVPSLKTLYRMLERLEVYEMVLLKEGKAAADRRFRIFKYRTKTSRILERAEIDHTPLDLFIVDERTWLPLGRPTLTVVIDHYSRMLLGYYLTFDSPSAAALMGALRHAILPKQLAELVIPNVKINHTWPCYGLPEFMAVDNGLEFHGIDFESVAFDLGIRIQACPKHQPRFKGVVERYLKTINYNFASQIPGASFSRFYQRGDYDPLKSAILTFAQFKQVFEKWVVDVYAQKLHRGIGTTPWAKWHESLPDNEPTLPPDLQTLQRRIGKVEERKLRPDGILVNGIRYNGDNLAPILMAYDAGIRVRLVYDPEDLGEIQVWGPDSPEPVAVKALDWEYAKGLTEKQNEFVRQILKEQGKKAENRAELVRARNELASAVESLMISPKQKKRQQSGALRGFTSSRPNGSELIKDKTSKSKQIYKSRDKTKQDNEVKRDPPPILPTFQMKHEPEKP
jgi:putative transposase